MNNVFPNELPPSGSGTRGLIWAIGVWMLLTVAIVGVFAWGATADYPENPSALVAATKAMLLPGETTHGHYQIELDCSACHTPSMGVSQDACLNCHQQELKESRDTHPKSKFSDPTNAARLKQLDATQCITCHREHVPDQTHPMGLSLPTDYCFHCHQEVLERRPSHAGFAFDSCATAGCHNYHDNRALYENFLAKHFDEPELLVNATVPQLETAGRTFDAPLNASDQDAPVEHRVDGQLLGDWAETMHARAGVNCNACHLVGNDSGSAPIWNDSVSHDTCRTCHEHQVDGWLAGRHGMRLAQNLSPMTPAEARLPMKSDRIHEQMDCSSCHSGHRFDTRYAAVDACLSCHNDSHSLAYQQSSHFELWQSEISGQSAAGTGVSCATCHMPRCKNNNGDVTVQHNQNDNLRPNEKMIRSVCMNCHGVGFSIDSLADSQLIERCFVGPPEVHNKSLAMVADWFADLEAKRAARKSKK